MEAPSKTTIIKSSVKVKDIDAVVIAAKAIAASVKMRTTISGIKNTVVCGGSPVVIGTVGTVLYYDYGIPSIIRNNGDFYLDLSTGGIYQQTAGVWIFAFYIATETQIPFSWGDATPAVLGVFEVGKIIYSISLVILEPFDGIGASLSIGVDGNADLFMATNECDPKTAEVYSVTPGYKFAVEKTVKLFITPGAGATKGNGVIMINYLWQWNWQ